MHFHQLRKEITELLEMGRTRWRRRLLHHGLLPGQALMPAHSRLEFEALLSRTVRDAPYIMLDTETTGFEPYGGDTLVQFAFIEYHGLEPTGREFCRVVNPGRPIPARSTAIHGITDEQAAQAPPIDELINDIVAFIDGHVLVGHHVAFDLRFLDRVTRRCRLGDIPNPRLDTAMLYLAAGGCSRSIDLDRVAADCGVEIPGRHDARGDALGCGLIFNHLASRLDPGGLSIGELIERVHPIAGLSAHHPAEIEIRSTTTTD